MDSECHLSEFGAHAKSRGNPHPEDGTRAANGDRACDTGNVSGSNGSSQSCADCLERSHGTVGSIAFAENASDGHTDGIREFADLQKAQAKA